MPASKFPFAHLSLAEIAQRTALDTYRKKLRASGLELGEEELATWARLHRIRRWPPIYEIFPEDAA